MERLRIETAQNVDIEHNVASIGERMLAHLLDYCFFFGYMILIVFIMAFTQPGSWAIFFILMLPLLLYDLFFEVFFNGQSLGKMIIKIRVVRLDGSASGIGNYIIRWIFRIADNLMLMGSVAVLTLILNSKGQRLGDIAAGTTVIRTRKQVSLQNTFLINMPDDYTPVFTDVRLLNDKDIRTIREAMSFLAALKNSETRIVVGEKTKAAIEKKLSIKSDLPPQQFLETILNDYCYLYRG